ncbi:MAG TPA: heavy metal translocating P-type ATPase [Firmicutes bacterium]|nr:heavy metal translocating P-type ATPase [Bacillota bacterium]
MDKKFDVTGMTCSACSSHVEKSVCKLVGEGNVSVSLLTNSMQVKYDEKKISEEDIIKAVEDAGYGASVAGAPAAKKAEKKGSVVDEEIKEMKTRLIISFIFLIPLMYVSMGSMAGLPQPSFLTGHANAVSFAFTQFLMCLPIIYVNRKYFIVGYKTLWHRAPNMDSLIAVGSTAALAYGIFAIYRMSYGLGAGDYALVEKYHMDLYFESSVMILTLITLGKFLETRSRRKTSEAISRLTELAPETAVVERNGVETEIPIEELNAGDIVIVKPGTRIPADGIIVDGNSSVDESALTGESIPVEKTVGDKIIAASINKNGFLKFRAEKVGSETTLAQIIKLVEDASASKAPIAKLADKIAGVFVPVVMTIALVTAIAWLATGHDFEFALSCAISVLVISCPCALGLATPVAIMVGTGKGAENGILIKSAEALETLHLVKTVIMDKTGTLTEGKPVVTDIYSIGIDENELLALAASAEKPSEHPLAGALIEDAEKKGINLFEAEDFRAVSGRGVTATVDGRKILAGNKYFMSENGIDVSVFEQKEKEYSNLGKTVLYFAGENNPLGLIAVQDVPKKTSRAAVKCLRDMGIDVIMLTGDNKRTAEAVARSLGITNVVSEVMPQDKEAVVRSVQEKGGRTAMIGDGINDAPALARADVGIAIGAGTDVAIESADIVLMKSDLMDAVTAIKLSKATIKNVKENLFWAFFYNIICIPLAAGVWFPAFGIKLSPMIGAAAMSMSSVCVVSNALRLKFFKVDNNCVLDDEPAGEINVVSQNEYKGETNMKKEMLIEGMSCMHCSGRVEKALNGLDGVNAKVDLEKKTAYVDLSKDVSDADLTKAVTDAGYEVVSIK